MSERRGREAKEGGETKRKCKGGGWARQKGLKKEREKDAGSEQAKAERVKDGEVGQVRSDVDSDAAKIRPRTEGGWNRREDVGRTCKDEWSVVETDFMAGFLQKFLIQILCPTGS